METTLTCPTEVLIITVPPVMHKGITGLNHCASPYYAFIITMNIVILE